MRKTLGWRIAYMSELSTIFRRDAFPQKKRAFVLMPFREPYDTIYTSRIAKTAGNCGLECIRADEIYTDKTIMGNIWSGIQEAEVIIADLSDKNANVMYELGLSHALWRKTILLAQNINDVPFDLRSLRIVLYSPNNLDQLQAELTKFLRALVNFPPVDPLWTIRDSILQQHAFFGDDITGTEFDWKSMMGSLQKEITIFGPTLSFWLNDDDARAALVEHVSRRRELLLVLSTWEPIVAFGGTGPADLKKSITQLIHLYESLPPAQRTFLKSRFHVSVSTLSGVLSDPREDTGRLCLTLRLADQHNSAARFFIGLRRDQQPALFDSTTKAFFNFRYLGEEITPEGMIQRGIDAGYVR
jgi:hypothetical protein